MNVFREILQRLWKSEFLAGHLSMGLLALTGALKIKELHVFPWHLHSLSLREDFGRSANLNNAASPSSPLSIYMWCAGNFSSFPGWSHGSIHDPYVERKSSNAMKKNLSSAHLNVFDLQRGLSDGERADLLQQASFNIIDGDAPVYLGNAQKHTD